MNLKHVKSLALFSTCQHVCDPARSGDYASLSLAAHQWKEPSPMKLGWVTYFESNGGDCHFVGVSKNRGTPKWMVFDGKPYGWFGGPTPIFGNTLVPPGVIFWGHCWNILSWTSMIPAACSIVPWSAPIQSQWTWLHGSWNKRPWTLTFAGGGSHRRHFRAPFFFKRSCFRCFLKRFKFKNIDLLMWFS